MLQTNLSDGQAAAQGVPGLPRVEEHGEPALAPVGAPRPAVRAAARRSGEMQARGNQTGVPIYRFFRKKDSQFF